MTIVSLKLTITELELLTALASDQLFRREFIDPKLPGHRPNSEEVARGKALVARMRSMLDPNGVKRTPPVRVSK
jgi:hypothetical protein